jgi:HSP20 family protein
MDSKTKATEKKGAEKEVIPVKKDTSPRRFSAASWLTPFEEMERWAEEFFPAGWLHSPRRDWPARSLELAPFEGRLPNIDVVNRDDEVFIKAELPGVTKDDIEVSLTDNMLTIKGSSRKEEKEEKGDYYRCEISQGAFSRSVSLPADVNIDKSQAKFKDGVLELRLPKLEQAKRRKIKVE